MDLWKTWSTSWRERSGPFANTALLEFVNTAWSWFNSVENNCVSRKPYKKQRWTDSQTFIILKSRTQNLLNLKKEVRLMHDLCHLLPVWDHGLWKHSFQNLRSQNKWDILDRRRLLMFEGFKGDFGFNSWQNVLQIHLNSDRQHRKLYKYSDCYTLCSSWACIGHTAKEKRVCSISPLELKASRRHFTFSSQ